jgi:DNA-binding transcriptional LysR family regulator
MRPPIELRLLQCVVTLAEELSFTSAAKKLYLAQPALSRHIKELEQLVGTKLFDRSTRRVALTPAGAVFVEEARAALVHSERAGRLAKAVARDATSPLLIGFSPHYNFELLQLIKKRSISCFGSRGVTFTSSYTHEQINRILDGTWDIGLCFFPVKEPDLNAVALIEEPVSVVLSKDHKLAQKRRGKIWHRDLKNETVILFSRKIHPGFSHELNEFWTMIGYAPKETQDVNTITEALALVSEGSGIGFVKSSLRSMLSPSIRMLDFPMEETFKIRMGVMYRKMGRSNKSDRFLELLADMRKLEAYRVQDKVRNSKAASA